MRSLSTPYCFLVSLNEAGKVVRKALFCNTALVVLSIAARRPVVRMKRRRVTKRDLKMFGHHSRSAVDRYCFIS